jgi:hypothetical protein
MDQRRLNRRSDTDGDFAQAHTNRTEPTESITQLEQAYPLRGPREVTTQKGRPAKSTRKAAQLCMHPVIQSTGPTNMILTEIQKGCCET